MNKFLMIITSLIISFNIQTDLITNDLLERLDLNEGIVYTDQISSVDYIGLLLKYYGYADGSYKKEDVIIKASELGITSSYDHNLYDHMTYESMARFSYNAWRIDNLVMIKRQAVEKKNISFRNKEAYEIGRAYGWLDNRDPKGLVTWADALNLMKRIDKTTDQSKYKEDMDNIVQLIEDRLIDRFKLKEGMKLILKDGHLKLNDSLEWQIEKESDLSKYHQVFRYLFVNDADRITDKVRSYQIRAIPEEVSYKWSSESVNRHVDLYVTSKSITLKASLIEDAKRLTTQNGKINAYYVNPKTNEIIPYRLDKDG